MLSLSQQIELDYICLLQQQRIKYIIFKDDDDDEEVDEGINNKNKNNIHSENYFEIGDKNTNYHYEKENNNNDVISTYNHHHHHYHHYHRKCNYNPKNAKIILKNKLKMKTERSLQQEPIKITIFIS